MSLESVAAPDVGVTASTFGELEFPKFFELPLINAFGFSEEVLADTVS